MRSIEESGFERKSHKIDGGADGNDGGTGGGVELISQRQTGDARKQRNQHGNKTVVFDIVGDVARGGGGQYQQGIDDENADPLNGNGNDDGEHGGENRFYLERGDASAASE